MRLPEAVSRLAAPFFGSQAEPSSRQRGMFGPYGSVCLAFGETYISNYVYVLRRCFVWPMHGVIVILRSDLASSVSPFTPHRVGGELHLVFMV